MNRILIGGLLVGMVWMQPVFAQPGRLAWSRVLRPPCATNVTSVLVVLHDAVAPSAVQTLGTTCRSLHNLRPLFPATASTLRQAAHQTPAARRLAAVQIAEIAPGATADDALDELHASPLVEFAEPNYVGHLCAAPNDTLFNNQWALHNTHQYYLAVVNGVQTLTRGTADKDIDWYDAWPAAMPSQAVTVAVLDSGVDYTHPELTNQLWRNTGEIPDNGIDDDLNGYVDDVIGYDMYNEDNNPMDDFGHGTHVAGTLAAQAANGLGIAGVCPAAKIMAVKIVGANNAIYLSDAVRAMVYAADNGATVINASWGFSVYAAVLKEGVDYANEHGCAVVAASGNDGALSVLYPAGLPNVMAVSATDDDDISPDFANIGYDVKVCAPGVNILSLRANNTDMYGDGVHLVSNAYYLSDGTSMATPHAAGVAANLAAKYPGHSPWVYERVLQVACDNIDALNPAYAGLLGAGRVNLGRAMGITSALAVACAQIERVVLQSQTFVPTGTRTVALSIATLDTPVNDVWLSISNATAGITLSTNVVYVGAMAANAETNLPPGTVAMVVQDSAHNTYQTMIIGVYAGAQKLSEQRLTFPVLKGFGETVKIADLDNDGTNEFITSYVNVIYVFDYTGHLRWGYEAPVGMSRFNQLAVGDITGDGRPEVVGGLAAPDNARICVLGPGGAMLAGWPQIIAGSFTSPALADVDEDGILDVVVGAISYTTTNEVRAYKGDGTLLWRRAVPLGLEPTASAVGDLDHDGWPEVVTIAHNDSPGTYQNTLMFTAHTGGAYRASIDYNGWSIDTPPVLGDLDCDGDLEVLFAGFKGYYGAYEQRIAIYHHDGTPFAGSWPKTLTNIWTGYDCFPRLADVDNNGDLEIFFDGYQTRMYAWHHTGIALSNFPFASGAARYIEDQPCLADINGDGHHEIISGLNTRPGYIESNTTLMAWHVNTTTVPGYPVTFAQKAAVYDFCIGNRGTDSNQYIAVVGGGGGGFIGAELFVYNTGAPSNDLPRSWPSTFHDNCNALCMPSISNAPLVASFSADHTIGINAIAPTFTAYWNPPYTNDVTFYWDFNNDGTFDAAGEGLAVTSALYSTLGYHAVGLTVSNAYGEGATRRRVNYLQVIPPVTCAFYANVLTANAPITVQFTSICSNMPQYWRWDFDGDGHTDSTKQHPSCTYTATGQFTVTLTVSNNFGKGGASSATAVRQHYIIVPDVGDPTVHYVAPFGRNLPPYKNWDEAATTVQAAINAAGSGHQVIVTNGVYECGNTIKMHDITMRSVNGAGVTILHGAMQSNVVQMTTEGGVLDGFTIRNGKHLEAPYTVNGAGVSAGVGCAVRNCSIVNNGVFGTMARGGGVYLSYKATIENCFIASNFAYGAGGIHCDTATTARYCTVVGNVADYGAGVFMAAQSLVDNCLMTGNDGDTGIVFARDNATMRNCTIAGNIIATPGSPVIETLYGANIQNTVVSGNNAPSTTNRFAAGIIYNNSLFDALPPAALCGALCITGNPLFVNAAARNYRLATFSPCIDRGTTAVVTTTNDLAGLPRVRRSTVDMGCYEYQLGASVVAPALLSPIALESGQTGAYTALPGEPTVISGTKSAHTLVVVQQNYGAWTTSGVQQALAGTDWSNLFVGAAYAHHQFFCKSTDALLSEISTSETALAVNVLPEPACVAAACGIVVLARRWRAALPLTV